MERMDAFKRVFKELLKGSFARPALRQKRNSARELNATRACSQAASEVKGCCFLHVAQPLTLAFVLVLSHNATSQKGRTLRDETRDIRPLDGFRENRTHFKLPGPGGSVCNKKGCTLCACCTSW